MSIPLTCAGPSGSGTSVDITTGLVAWLKLDDGSGTTAADSSGSGNDGDLNGTPTWGAGQVNGALVLDGTDDSIQFTPALTTTTTFSLCLWFKPNAQVESYGTVFGKSDGSIGVYYLGSGVGANAGKLDFYYSGSHMSTAALTDAAWNHIMIIVDAGSVTQYLNNAPNGTSSSAPSFAADYIGNDAASETLKGTVDDVRLYSIALSSEQRAAVYNYAG